MSTWLRPLLARLSSHRRQSVFSQPASAKSQRGRPRSRLQMEQLEARDVPAFVITPTFDTTITSDPQAATIEASINRVIQAYEDSFSDNITVNITFQEVTTGLGGSSTATNTVSYTSYLAALTSHATTADDTTALASLPAGPTTPVGGSGNTNVTLANALANALGLASAASVSSTISLNTSSMNLDRTSAQNASNYDLMDTTAHEIDEALGLGSAMDGQVNGATANATIKPLDLFRYSGNGTRSYDTLLATVSYFSIDGGATNLVGFNQYSPGTGTPPNTPDMGDWFSNNGAGNAVNAHVQDSNAQPGQYDTLNVELRRLDVLGYTRVATAAPVVTPGGDQTAVEGSTATINLGSFAASSPNAPWGVTVNWGDATSSPIFFLNSAGSLGSLTHIYAEEGSYTVTVTVTDFVSQSDSKSFKVSVSDPAMLGTPVNITAVEGAAFTGKLVATFTDPGGAELSDNPVAYSATIDWGDGTAPTPAVIFTPDAVVFNVRGDHTYAEEGTYVTTVVITHEAAPTTTVFGSAVVSDPAVIPAGGFGFSAVEGASSTSQTVATFTDPGGPEALGDYSADVDWGDGTTASAGTITYSSGTGVFTVSAVHLYGEEGAYTITVTVHHETATDAQTASTATVSDPAVAPTGGFQLITARGAPLCDVTVATFTDPGGAEPNASDPGPISDHYSATIDWGDGTPASAGEISYAAGVFTVAGDHAYVGNGTYTITVTAHHEAAPDAQTTSTATVSSIAIGQGPCDPDTLLIGGTQAGDSIVVSPVGNTGAVKVQINDEPAVIVPGGSFSSIAVYAQDGDDNVQVAGSIARTAFLFSQGGNDRLKGGGGDNLLVGGAGNDTLISDRSSGFSVLIGGAGVDRLVGNGGDDLLIGGAVDFEDPLNCDNDPYLCDLLHAWAVPTQSYGDRAAAVAPLLAGHVTDDHAADTLTGSSGQDLFYFSVGDTVTDKKPGEIGVTI